MTDTTGTLTAAELREALGLVLAELGDMGVPPADRGELGAYCQRQGRLTSRIEGILNRHGDGTQQIALGLLREDAQQHPRQAADADQQQAPAPAPAPLRRDQAVPDARAQELADGAIGLFLEYRDVHGCPEGRARPAAVQEVLEGERAREEIDWPAPLWVGGRSADHDAECEQGRGWQR